jgi:hydrogenase maturation protease
MNPNDSRTGHTLFVGLGSRIGDDQIGWNVSNGVATKFSRRNLAIRIAESPMQILDWLDGITKLVICDACRGLGRVGEVRRWLWPAKELLDVSWSGTHDLPLTTALHLAERLGRLPNQVVIWSIEAGDDKTFDVISPVIANVVPGVIDQITNELAGDVTVKTNHA